MGVGARMRWGCDGVALGVLMTVPMVSALAFGGAVWWCPPLLAILVGLGLIATLLRLILMGRWPLLIGPWVPALFGLVVIGALQLAPLPAPLAVRASPRSQEAYTQGALTDLIRRDDPQGAEPKAAQMRTPVSLDRGATLRWTAGALLCLGLAWMTAQLVDRPRRLVLVASSIVAAFAWQVLALAIQVAGGAEGLYGAYVPGARAGPLAMLAPTRLDQESAPHDSQLIALEDPDRAATPLPWIQLEPELGPGGLMGGPDALLALAAIALPLALGLALHGLAPRGSRDRFWTRMRDRPSGAAALLLGVLTLGASGLMGWLAGPWLAIGIGLVLAITGLLASLGTGLGALGPSLTLASVLLLGLSAGLANGSETAPPDPDRPLVRADSWPETVARWHETARIARDFPLLGAGLGCFDVIHPYYKGRDERTATASSSLLQLAAEAGLAGLAVVGLALAWSVIRLPFVLARIGGADRALAAALLGSALLSLGFAAIQWTWQLPVVAICLSLILGLLQRWLAGGTDLFATT